MGNWDPILLASSEKLCGTHPRLLRPGAREAGTFIPRCLQAAFKRVNPAHTSNCPSLQQNRLPRAKGGPQTEKRA